MIGLKLSTAVILLVVAIADGTSEENPLQILDTAIRGQIDSINERIKQQPDSTEEAAARRDLLLAIRDTDDVNVKAAWLRLHAISQWTTSKATIDSILALPEQTPSMKELISAERKKITEAEKLLEVAKSISPSGD